MAEMEFSLSLAEMIRTTQQMSATERLLLARALLDSLVGDEANQLAIQAYELEEMMSPLEDVVAQIKATPPNPAQIQRATKTIDEVMADWNEDQPEEPRLTAEEWEQTWWLVRQEMKQRDRKPDPVTEWIA